MDTLRAAVRPDPVKTTVIDMTPLNLVEMTRKKEKRPFWEQIAQVQKKSVTRLRGKQRGCNMKIIIVGCGKVGLTLTEQLNNEGHDITVIDKDGSKLRSVTDNIDVMGVEGNGAIYQVQMEAGIKETDLLIATTNSDELNMLCCLIAKKAGNCHTIARIRNPEYSNEVQYIREELNLSMAINPELGSHGDSRLLKFPSVIKIDAVCQGPCRADEVYHSR